MASGHESDEYAAKPMEEAVRQVTGIKVGGSDGAILGRAGPDATGDTRRNGA